MPGSIAVPHTDTGPHQMSPNAAAAASTIRVNRARIDVIDEKIVELLEERVTLSIQIQVTRMTAGGTRLAHARENQIIRRYRGALGKLGADFAHLILKLSRGNAPGQRWGGEPIRTSSHP